MTLAFQWKYARGESEAGEGFPASGASRGRSETVPPVTLAHGLPETLVGASPEKAEALKVFWSLVQTGEVARYGSLGRMLLK